MQDFSRMDAAIAYIRQRIEEKEKVFGIDNDFDTDQKSLVLLWESLTPGHENLSAARTCAQCVINAYMKERLSNLTGKKVV